MADLFRILDGINSDDYAEQTLNNINHIMSYAEAMGEDITFAQAERIAEVGKAWRHEVATGNGEWSRMRRDAIRALEEE